MQLFQRTGCLLYSPKIFIYVTLCFVRKFPNPFDRHLLALARGQKYMAGDFRTEASLLGDDYLRGGWMFHEG